MRIQGRVVAGITFALAVASIVFEQSPANEAVRANVAFRTLDVSGDSVVVGLVVAMITIAIEGTAALFVLVAMDRNPAAIEWIRRRLRIEPSDGAATKRFGLTDIGIALGVGAAIVVLRRYFKAGVDNATRRLVMDAILATMVIAVVSGLIGYLASGGIATARRYGLETPANYIVRYGADWKFWFLLIFGVQALSFVWRRIRPNEPHTARTSTTSSPR